MLPEKFESSVPLLRRFDVIIVTESGRNLDEMDPALVAEPHLLVWVEPHLNEAFLINLDAMARFPISYPYQELISFIADGYLDTCGLDLHQKALALEGQHSERDKIKIRDRWQAIEPLTKDLENTLRNGRGQRLFERAAKESGRSKQYVYDSFYSWLRNKCIKQALALPQGKEANRVPQERKIYVKQGAPNQIIPKGKVLDDRDYQCFEIAKKMYLSRKRITIKKALLLIWLKHYYKERVLTPEWERDTTKQAYKVKLLPESERPSYNQFRYWLNKQFDGNVALRDRSKSPIKDAKSNLDGRSGDPFAYVFAPGQLYMVDETPFDEELVCSFDQARQRKIGKATLYFVRDVATKAIVGFSVTLLKPSFATIREALYNSFRDKEKVYEELGIKLDPGLLPQKGVPSRLLVDHAEFNNRLSDGAVCDLNLQIDFTRSGRGDDKGLVESAFNIFSQLFKGVSDAHTPKALSEIRRQVARKNAALTLRELKILTAYYVIHYNNHHVLNDPKMVPEMVSDGVKPIPNSLWNWGIKNTPGYLCNYSDDEVYLSLLEKGEVSIRRDKITLLGKSLRYDCEWVFASGLQVRKLSKNRSIRLSCRYHRGLVDYIYICTSDGLKIANLNLADRRYAGLSFEEVSIHKNEEKKRNAELIVKETESLANLTDKVIRLNISAMNDKKNNSNIGREQITINGELVRIGERIEQKWQFQNLANENGRVTTQTQVSDSTSEKPEEEESEHSDDEGIYDDD